MPITVNCPGCGGAVQARDEFAGRKVKCPKCAAVIALPEALPEPEAIRDAAPLPVASPEPRRESRPRARDDDAWEGDRPERSRRIADESEGPGNGLAIAGMVLGIVGFVAVFIPCIGWVLAVALGIVGATLSGIGLGTASKRGAAKGMAVTGLVLSIIAIIWGPIWIFIIWGMMLRGVGDAVQQMQVAAKNQQFKMVQPGQPVGAPTPASGKLALQNGQAMIQSSLTANDPRDRARWNSACKVFTINLAAGKTYQIDMIKNAGGLDPYLRLEDPAGNNLAEDDDSGGFRNARLQFACPQTGEYRIVATTFGGGSGNFTLTVAEQ
jgi:Bacterial pre-peptidase C-terminal domain